MITIPKPGKTKQELLQKLETLKTEFTRQISENQITIEDIPDGFKINAEKKVLFLTFYVKADIIAKDESYEITWDSNAPQSKVNEALDKVKEILEK